MQNKCYSKSVITIVIIQCKVGRVFSMVIWPELHTGQHRDGDHQEHAPYFTMAFTLGIVYRWL